MNSATLIKHMIYRSGILLLVKLLGILVRIPLFRILGPEGIGFYQMAYALYGFTLTIISGGLPTALALVTAQNPLQGQFLIKRLAVVMLILGFGMGFVFFQYSNTISLYMGIEQLSFAIRCTAPAICIVPFLSLLRGYLQGLDLHGQIACSELVEQGVRVIVMAVAVYYWLPYGLSYAVGGAITGAFAGAVAAIVFFLLALNVLPFKGAAGKSQDNSHQEIRLFLYSSFSLSATRFIVPLSDFLDAYLVPDRLQSSGYSASEAVSIFGELAGMGALVVYMPTLITTALAYTLSTKLTSDWHDRRKNKFITRSEFALRMGWLWGAATSFFLFLFADTLSRVLFSDSSATKAISSLAIIPLIAGFRELTTVILWARGNKLQPLLGLIVAITVSLLSNFFITATPGFGYTGAVIGMLSLEVISALWNSVALGKTYPLFRFNPNMVIETIKVLGCLFFVYIAVKRIFSFFDFEGFVPDIAHMMIVFSAVALYFVNKMYDRQL